jgi:hypothetical protein
VHRIFERTPSAPAARADNVRQRPLTARVPVISSQAMDTTDEDVRALIKSIHEDRVAAKDKEKRDGWTRYVSLMVVVLAVATAIGSLKAGGFGSRVMLNQAQASDTWALYQAKSV